MSQFFTTLLAICLFRARPQDLVPSSQLLVISMLGAFLAFWFRNMIIAGGGQSIAIAFTHVAILAVALKLLLGIFSKSERWLQSASALLGCSALLVLFILPLLISTGGLDPTGGGMSLSKLGIIIASVWYFAIIVFILRETLEIGLFLGFVIALVLELASASVLIGVFGERML